MSTLPTASAAAGETGRAVTSELSAMLRLAVPLAIVQVGQIGVNVVETLLLGRLGAHPLAAASLGLSLFHPLLLFGIGVVSAASPLLAAAVGGRQPRRIRRIVRQSFWLAALIAAPLTAIMWWVRPLLALTGQDPALLAETERFAHALMWSMWPALGFVALRCFTTAFGDTRALLAITMTAVPASAVIGYPLIFGLAWLPGLGIVGAGLAATISQTLMFLALLAYCLKARTYRRYRIFGRFWRPDWTTFRSLFGLGLPIGAALLLEVGMFATSALLVGRIGIVELAGHQVTLQIASFFFMVPLGIGLAATIRVGLATGRIDRAGARRAGFVAVGLGLAFNALVALLFLTAAPALTGLFLDPTQGESEAAALAFAITYLHVAAFFLLFDAVQVIGISALRGLQDTRVPMVLAGIGYWIIGYPAAALLGLGTSLAGAGVWAGMAFALAFVAVTMLRRFDRLTRPLAARGPV